MATISTIKLSDLSVPTPPDSRPVYVDFNIPISATLADNGDNIELFDLPAGLMFIPAASGVDATLGASCTIQLRVGTVAVTAATTAGGASSVGSNAADVDVSESEASVNFLVGGADISAAANAHVRGFIIRPISVTIEA